MSPADHEAVLAPVERAAPCVCWTQPRLYFHEGHCCFGDGFDDVDGLLVCGHEALGRAMRAETKAATT